MCTTRHKSQDLVQTAVRCICTPSNYTSFNHVRVEQYFSRLPARVIFWHGTHGTAILTGINTFFNHSKKQIQHFEFSTKFFRLATEIEKEMSKKKRDRLAADIFVERVSMDYNNLAFNAPAL